MPPRLVESRRGPTAPEAGVSCRLCTGAQVHDRAPVLLERRPREHLGEEVSGVLVRLDVLDHNLAGIQG